jgi:hypothetical protein
MYNITKSLFSSIVALTLPIAFFLLFWWSSLLFTINNKTIATIALIGFGLGFAINILIQRSKKYKIYLLPQWMLITIYSFYSICLFGFFMGVPIFHPILGILAGYYWAQRITIQNTSRKVYKRNIKKIAQFTTIWMSIIAVSSASIALTDKYTSANLKGMLNLSSNISSSLLIVFIIIGGLLLIFLQYWLTKVVMTKQLYRKF